MPMCIFMLAFLCTTEALQIANDIMKPVNFECPDGESITAIQSWHSDWHDDRQWAFGCSKFPEPATVSNCKWTGDSINVAASDQNQNNQQFSTPDQDHDNSATLHCAKGNNHGGWWFNACGYANLNGRYGAEGYRGWEGVVWYHWKNDNRSLKHVEMKIRPRA
nr:hypothetical protein BaRGS_012198 [Batillaria attramentaria]